MERPATELAQRRAVSEPGPGQPVTISIEILSATTDAKSDDPTVSRKTKCKLVIDTLHKGRNTIDAQRRSQDTLSQPEKAKFVIGRETRGNMPKSAFQLRVPPLWCYTQGICISIDRRNKLVYILLDEDVKEMQRTAKEIESYWEEHHQQRLTVKDLSEGLLVSANQLGGNMPMRAQVTKFDSEDNIELFYIDIGVTERATLEDLKPLASVKALKVGRLAIPCRLTNSLTRAKAYNSIRIGHPALVCLSAGSSNSSVSANAGVGAKPVQYRIEDILPRPSSWQPPWASAEGGSPPPVLVGDTFTRERPVETYVSGLGVKRN